MIRFTEGRSMGLRVLLAEDDLMLASSSRISSGAKARALAAGLN
jgi:hypothetical protein